MLDKFEEILMKVSLFLSEDWINQSINSNV